MAEKKKMTFEENIEKLEQILSRLEDDKLPLDTSVKLYEEGISLVRGCSETLDRAEMSIKMLQMKPDGNAVAVDFAGEDEA